MSHSEDELWGWRNPLIKQMEYQIHLPSPYACLPSMPAWEGTTWCPDVRTNTTTTRQQLHKHRGRASPLAGLKRIVPFLLRRLMLHPGDQHRYHWYRNARPYHRAYSSAGGYLHRDRNAGHRKYPSCASGHTATMWSGWCVPTLGRFYRD